MTAEQRESLVVALAAFLRADEGSPEEENADAALTEARRAAGIADDEVTPEDIYDEADERNAGVVGKCAPSGLDLDLRDKVAAQVFVGLVQSRHRVAADDAPYPEVCAMDAFVYADAFMAERAKRRGAL